MIHKKNKKGQLEDNLGRLINDKGYLVDSKGNVIDKFGKKLFDKDHLMDNEIPKIFTFTRFNIKDY